MKPALDGKRFSAILMADVVGYSRLMSLDVQTTVGQLKECRRIFSDIIGGHDGWVVNAPGDSILAEFPTAVDAVQSATEIQAKVEVCNQKVPPERRMSFRIGISQGEVVAEEDGIYGDEVNIAARLEGLADPGGVCISSIVHANIQGKFDPPVEFLGEHQLKNISRLVPVYRLATAGAQSGGSGETRANPTLSRRNKPSIAVLPFYNMGAGPEQEYFADGITEDLITELSRFKSLLVIARNSTFVYKDQAVSVEQVGRDLGVEYVLEGSIRKSGNRVRITGQLVDAQDGSHIWAEKYDRDLEDVFGVQDEIVRTIVANIPRRLEAANLERVKQQRTDNMAAFDLYLKGKDLHFKRTAQDNAQALETLDQVIDLDPDFAQAYAWKACTLGQAYVRGFIEPSETMIDEAQHLAEKSCALDDDDSEGHRILCEIHLLRRNYDQSERHHERAYDLNPNDPRILGQRGQLMTWTGRAEEAVPWLELARKLDPYPPELRADSLGMALFVARRYEEALKAFGLITKPTLAHLANMAACQAMLGMADAAAGLAEKVRELQSGFSADSYVSDLLYRDEADREHHRQALRQAGLD